MTGKEFIDVLIVVPLEEELLEVSNVFPFLEDRTDGTSLRYIAENFSSDLRVLVVQQQGMGNSHARRSVHDVLAIYDVGIIVCIGIAGSLSSDLRLCDVCYSESVIDILENAKVEDDGQGINISFSPTHFSTPAQITAALNFSRVHPNLRQQYAAWQEECKEFAASILPDPVIERDGKSRILSIPNSKNGVIACGSVSKSSDYNAKIRSIERKILAIETESGGIFEIGKHALIPCLTIRGISDHADKNKNKLEEQTGAKVRRIAASNAAKFFKLQLQNPYFLSALKAASARNQLPLDLEKKEFNQQADNLIGIIASIEDVLDSRLRELSPEFKLQAKGYRLPVPRIREVQYTGALGYNFTSDPLEVRKALEADNVILLTLSRTYPDSSLPWVIANDLLKAEIDGKQALPIVVHESQVRPTARNMSSASAYGFHIPSNLNGTQIIYIIDGIPLESSTRMRFLESEIKSNPKCKFVIVTRNETSIVAESEFSASVGASLYNLTSVSFVEIAHFVQKNFELSSAESEVIALRLRDTFRHFDLSAHPTYFAGINKEVLTALLQANRRAELIQLAVDGFLTFVVAGDKAKITLSRTTRKKFLRKIACIIQLEERALSQSELIEFTKDFAEINDFEIDPIFFVTSFVDAGVLHFHEGNVKFSLPFIQSYLLAEELCEHPDKARSYFDLHKSGFDMGTFDLYAELGASTAVVDHVIDSIEISIENIGLNDNEQHILFGDIRPASLKSIERLGHLQQSMRRLTDDVQKGKGDKERKQRIIDIADRIRETAADKSKFGRDHENDGRSIDESKIRLSSKSWAVGTTLLGAAAEGLLGETKKRLAQDLVALGSSIVHRWTIAHVEVDFDQIKLDLTSESSINEIFSGSDIDASEAKKKIAGLVDLLEFSFLAEPARRILSHICEGARQKVLVGSVERASPEGLFEELFHGVWLSDIDSERGQKRLLSSIKALPNVPFLRIVLATHLLARVYWNHWQKEDRLRLLELAAESAKPLFQLDKGRIQRLVDRTANIDAEDCLDGNDQSS
ncbi:phosphorylase family protein [Methylobrevis albus]|uniref:Nucleoside phosphorylase domain-containing protein n=1 Tax=Methylobrevis albus TaxID=2793297 RepID=A0A931I394_9HYPH|nr:hypothetical protein [Methylobrevis albus]MBH0238471.1 hypothetical protein [Methylobrevis albus]